ncbi:MAG: RIP metalloprotease RseP [bacterium]|jgi:regulator of sigma E protease
MLAWLAPIAVLGIVVFVHELGHFLAAKALGVYAPRFALGWGPSILRWRPKGSETEYVLAALPIGGYVRMASKDDEAAAMLEGGNEEAKPDAEKDPRWDPDAMLPHGPKPVPQDRWFESKPTWARVVILLAGVTMNVLLTFSIATGVYSAKGRSYLPAVVDSLVVGLPAARAGVMPGDSIVALNGASIESWADFQTVVSMSAGKPIAMDVRRGGSAVTLTVVPDTAEGANAQTGAKERIGKVGVWPRGTPAHVALTLGQAATAGWETTWEEAGAIVGIVRGLFRGAVSVTQLGGPIAIARVSVRSAKGGWESLLALIAYLSINLAVLNLLPIPVLDGGQVLLTVAEGIKGGSFSSRTRENFMKVGIAAVALLFVIVMFNDLKGLALSLLGKG